MEPISTLQKKLGARPRQAMQIAGFRESAVLLPLCGEASSVELLFTVRHPDLPTHAGQIAFPGGKRDQEDADLQATAVRECCEELGVDQAGIAVIGWLDDVPTPSGFVITPVVAALCTDAAIAPNRGEVAAVFRAPLAALRDAGCYRSGGVHRFYGIEYVMHEYHFAEHRIWGATARMVHQLLSLLP